MKTLKSHFFIALCFALLLGGNSVSAQVIRGGNGSETPMKPFVKSAQKTRKYIKAQAPVGTPAYVKSTNEYVVLMFNQVLSAIDEAVFATHGLRFVNYLGDNTYIFSTPDLDKSIQSATKAIANTPVKILGISEIPPLFKVKMPLYTYLSKSENIPYNLAKEGIYVGVFQASDLDPLKQTLSKRDIAFNEKSEITNTLIINTTDANVLLGIIAIPYVSALENRELPTPEATSAFGIDWIMQPNQIAVVNYNHQGPTGRGTYFANWETYGKRDEYGISTYGRNVPGKTDKSDNGHGTDCALIVGGSNNVLDFSGQGMAPGVKILATNDAISPSFTAGVAPSIQAGYSPLVANHSVGWAVGISYYNSSASELDKATYENPSFIQCYSSGNSANGTSIYPPHVFPDYGNLTGDIKSNKNNFTVHSNQNVGEDVGFACFGPTSDGRLKPDICAEGTGGTSYASPGVAGMVSVLYETYREKYAEIGRSDVVKAVMLNTAIDMGTKGIDFRTGFGQINPSKAVRAIRSGQVAKDYAMPQGKTGEITHQITIPAGIVEARILLYWHDYPGAANTAQALVNDLDLEVISPDGTVTLPWVLDHRPERVKDLPMQKRDSLNNVEQVTFQNPAPGTYTIRVKGKSVVRGPQKFVLTWDLSPRYLKITSHPEGYKLSKGNDLFVSWNYADETGGIEGKKVDVYFKPNAGSDWTLAASETGKLYTKWKWDKLPAFLKNLAPTSTAQFKVVSGGMESESDYCQYMDTPQNLQLVSLCPNEATLTWDALPDFAGKYIIYTLGDQYMEAIDSVDNTLTRKSVTPQTGKSFTSGTPFAIAARDAATGALSLRSLPILADPYNTASNADTYSSAYNICYGDTIAFKTNAMEGTVTWFKNNAPLVNTDRVIKIGIDDIGKYAYQIANDKCTWKSGDMTVTRANGINISDTTQTGVFMWKACVFQGGNPNESPMYGKSPKYYGKYELNKLGFDSNTDIISWEKKQNEIPGYIGCAFPNKWNTTVLKRKGFVKGNYNIRLQRTSYRAKITITKGEQVLFNYLSSYNFSGNTVIKSNLALDETCEARIEWYGDHLVVGFERQGSAEPNNTPGSVKNGMGFWIDPTTANTDDAGNVTSVINRRVQNTLIVPDRENAGITINKAGINYNPTILFTAKGGLAGAFDVAYKGSGTSDFAVFKMNTSSNDWARVLGFGKTALKDWDNPTSYIAIERNDVNGYIGAMRNKEAITAPSVTTNRWQAVQTQFTATEVKITNKGVEAQKVSKTGGAFDIQDYILGATFDVKDRVLFSGQIAEALHFNRAMTPGEEQKINSYLMLKYGLNSANDLVDASGATVLTVDPLFKTATAGVACDLVQALIQKQSKSEDTPADIMVGSIGAIAATNAENASEFVADKTFMIWAHNGKATSLNTATVTSNRVWKLSSALNKQPLRINFRKAVVPKSPNEELKLCLIVSQSADLADEKIIETQTYTGGDNVEYEYAETDVNADVMYFTFGYRVPTGVNALQSGGKSAVYFNKETKELIVKASETPKHVEVISSSGTVLKKITTHSENLAIATTELPTGVYLVKLTFNNRDYENHKVIID